MRSIGEELQPTSLRDVILQLKSDIQFYEREEKRLKGEREVASKRLKVARWKQNELKQKIFREEERRDRLDDKLKEAEKRKEKLSEYLQGSQDRIDRIDANKKSIADRSSELEMRVEQAKTWGQQIWHQLSRKLAERSQKHYHCTFVQSKAENIKSRIVGLEEHLGILKEKREMLLRHGAAKKSSVVKNRALIEQMEDDIKKSIERCSFANQQYLTMKLYKDSLTAETDNIRDMRRDLDDQMRSALRTRENRIINASYRAQYYR